jgi:hypothetical protein
MDHASTYAWQLRIWLQAVFLQEERLRDAAREMGTAPAPPPAATVGQKRSDDQVWAEVAFFVFAVRNVMRYAERLATTEILRKAFEVCRDEIASAARARNWIEHLDEYIEGKGRDSSLSTAPAMQAVFPVSEEQRAPFGYEVGGVIIEPEAYTASLHKMMEVFLGQRL